jgi:hypothetical protein
MRHAAHVTHEPVMRPTDWRAGGDMVNEALTHDGTITDVPAALRTCATCGAELFVEAVSTTPRARHAVSPGRRYALRCPKGHEESWAPGEAQQSDPH